MSTYMKTNALNTAFQLLKVIASGKLLQEQITEAEAELHIHFDQKQLLTANSALLDLLEKMILICSTLIFAKSQLRKKIMKMSVFFSFLPSTLLNI